MRSQIYLGEEGELLQTDGLRDPLSRITETNSFFHT